MIDENIMIGDAIYIVGHKVPDVDAIVSAYAYQVYRHSRGDFNYVAIRCDEVNPVTKWIFKEAGLELPKLVEDVSNHKLVLVDHTDPEQRAFGWENAEIIEVVDHHKLKLETTAPAKITIRPYGSTTTLIAEKLIRHNIGIEEGFAFLLLSAILDDTVALRSPITTGLDKVITGKLAVLANITDVDSLAKKIFDKKDQWHKMKADEIVSKDTKRYEIGDLKVGISQIETMDYTRLEKKFTKIQKEIDKIAETEGLDLMLAVVTDIIRKEARILASGPERLELEKVFETKFTEDLLTLEGVVSRKKQIIPPLMNYYK